MIPILTLTSGSLTRIFDIITAIQPSHNWAADEPLWLHGITTVSNISSESYCKCRSHRMWEEGSPFFMAEEDKGEKRSSRPPKIPLSEVKFAHFSAHHEHGFTALRLILSLVLITDQAQGVGRTCNYSVRDLFEGRWALCLSAYEYTLCNMYSMYSTYMRALARMHIRTTSVIQDSLRA